MDILSRKRIEELKTYGYNFDIGGYISQGINIIKKDAGLFMGYTLIAGMILMLASSVSSLFQFIGPQSIVFQVIGQFLGNIVTQLIAPPLMAGYLLASHKMYNNEGLEFGDFFKGFEYYAQLIIQSMILLGISLVILTPFLVVLFILGGMSFYGLENISSSQIIILILTGIIILMVYIYIYVSYLFSYAFVVFGDMKAWEALETSRLIVAKNFWSIFGFSLILMILFVIGYITCCVGLLFTLPIIQASIYAAFRDLMGFDNPDIFNEDGDIMDHLVD